MTEPSKTPERHPDMLILREIARGRLPGADCLDRHGNPAWTIPTLCSHWRIPVSDLLAVLPKPKAEGRQHGDSAYYELHR